MARKRHSQKGIKKVFVLAFICCLSFVATYFLLELSHRPPTCANSKSCSTDLSLKIDNNATAIFEGKRIAAPTVELSEKEPKAVLGAAVAPGEKHIFIDLSKQILVAYQGPTEVLRTFVSTGKWGRTPTGNFSVWEKLLSTRMTGGQGADFYDLPNVQYVMYFYHDFGLHTAYWHDNFGHVMSHGCVNMRKVDAKALYNWVDAPEGKKLGTAVSVCDRITDDKKCIQDNPVEL